MEIAFVSDGEDDTVRDVGLDRCRYHGSGCLYHDIGRSVSDRGCDKDGELKSEAALSSKSGGYKE